MINFITYYSFKLFCLANTLIPRRFSIFLGKILGCSIYFLSKKSKDIAKININIAFPNLSKKKSKRILINTFKHYGIIIFEFFRQKNITNKNTIVNIDDITNNILSDKSGLILMSAHIGNWEMLLPLISSKRNISAIVKKQSNNAGDRFISELRLFKNVTLISNKSTFNEMLKPLLDNEVLLILNDQKPKKSGTSLNFFGKDALFPNGSGHFHLKSNCRVAVGFCTLNSSLNYDLKIRLIEINSKKTSKNKLINDINIKYAKLLENEIIKYPEQYCWFYKKWDKSFYR